MQDAINSMQDFSEYIKGLSDHEVEALAEMATRQLIERKKPVIQIASLEGFCFAAALAFLKGGNKVARAGWNGKGMFLYHVPANSYPAVTDIAKETFGDMVPYGAYIAMKTAQNNVVPWLASQTDLLADDWQIVN